MRLDELFNIQTPKFCLVPSAVTQHTPDTGSRFRDMSANSSRGLVFHPLTQHVSHTGLNNGIGGFEWRRLTADAPRRASHWFWPVTLNLLLPEGAFMFQYAFPSVLDCPLSRPCPDCLIGSTWLGSVLRPSSAGCWSWGLALLQDWTCGRCPWIWSSPSIWDREDYCWRISCAEVKRLYYSLFFPRLD